MRVITRSAVHVFCFLFIRSFRVPPFIIFRLLGQQKKNASHLPLFDPPRHMPCPQPTRPHAVSTRPHAVTAALRGQPRPSPTPRAHCDCLVWVRQTTSPSRAKQNHKQKKHSPLLGASSSLYSNKKRKGIKKNTPNGRFFYIVHNAFIPIVHYPLFFVFSWMIILALTFESN